VQQEMRVMQSGQLGSNLTDRLAVGNSL